MNRLEELQRVFGGRIYDRGDRRWLDTRIGGLRVVVVQGGRPGRGALDLAVFTPESRELDPFLVRAYTDEWILDVVPSLSHGFVFTGCRSGVLYATSVQQPTLEDLVAALWELARWAREPWRPRTPSTARERSGRRERIGIIALLVLLWWLITRLRQ